MPCGRATPDEKQGSLWQSSGGLARRRWFPTSGPQFGHWTYLGHKQYIASFRFFRFHADGTFAGSQKVTRTLTLGKDKQSFTGTLALTMELRARGITPQDACRQQAYGSGLGVYRYVAEQVRAWLHGFKRLRIRYECTASTHEAFLSPVYCLICYCYL